LVLVEQPRLEFKVQEIVKQVPLSPQ